MTTDAQKVVKIISGDKARTQTYCDIGKLGDQIEEAEQKKDINKIDQLNKKIDELATKLGPEVCRVNEQASGHRPQFKRGPRDRFGARGTRQVVYEVTAGVPCQICPLMT